MLKLIIEKNVQIKEMEEQMEKLLKEKEDVVKLAMNTITSIPIFVARTTEDSTSTSSDLNKLMQDRSLQR